MPDWYPLTRAARYWGVPPWILAEQPAKWIYVALTAEAAELEAQKALNDAEIARQRAAAGGG